MRTRDFFFRILILALSLSGALMVADTARAGDGTVLQFSRAGYSVRLGGWIQGDYAKYFKTPFVGPDGSVSDIAVAGARIRRARVFAAGNLGAHWQYKIQYELTDDGVAGLRDAYLAYSGLAPGNSLVFGQSKTFFSLNQLNSANNNLLMERPLTEGLDTYGDRRLGIRDTQTLRNFVLGFGIFANAIDEEIYTDYHGVAKRAYTSQETAADIARISSNRSGIYTLSMRVAYLPIVTTRQTWYFAGYLNDTYFAPNNVAAYYGARRDQTDLDSSRLIEAFVSQPRNQIVCTVEGAAVFGAFSLEGSWTGTRISRRMGLNAAKFSGYALQVGYVLTGQAHRFDTKNATSVYLPDIGKWGAWEVVLRYDHLSLNDAVGGIYGGRGEQLTAGVNWYGSQNFRLMANYVRVHLDGIPETQPANATWWNDPRYNTRMGIVELRAQWLF